jgi:hypothetical protein
MGGDEAMRSRDILIVVPALPQRTLLFADSIGN